MKYLICYLLLLHVTVTSVCRKEEEKLQNENAKLKQDIENLKKRLTTAEINNGCKYSLLAV